MQRGTPTMLMNSGLMVFSSIIPIISVQVIDKEPSLITPNEEHQYRSRIPAYFLYEAIYCSAVSLIGLLLFRERPVTPPSVSELVKKPPFLREIRDLLKNCSFLLCVLSYGIVVAGYTGFHLLSSQILKKYGMLSRDIALINIIYLPVSILSIFIWGRIFRRLQRYKPLMLVNNVGLLALVTLLQFIVPTGVVPLIGGIMVL